MASKIEILRAVATAIGEEPPVDVSEDTDFLQQILPHWESVTADYSTRHAWTWGTEVRTLTAEATAPPQPWQYRFALPVDRTLIRDVFIEENGLPIDYEIEGVKLYADDAGPLACRINVAMTPDYWPGDFAMCVQTALEGYAWKGLRDEFQKGQSLIDKVDSEAGPGLLQKCIARDKRQRPPRKHWQGTIWQARVHRLSPRRRRDA
jgi:hypothetical protein